MDADSPSYTFVYAIRATEAGDATLPPVTISAFDPTTERYVTRVAPGVPIRVTDVAPFDRDRVSYPPTGSSDRPEEKNGRVARYVVSATAAVLTFAGLTTVASRWKRASRARRCHRRRIEAVRTAGSDDELARAITGEIIGFLSQSVDREPGALTPSEAEDGMMRATGSASLAADSKAVVEVCDAVLYGEAKADDFDLRDRALAFFGKLDRRLAQSR